MLLDDLVLDELVSVIETLKERIATHGATLREYETRTRMALINPMLHALGWDTADPALVIPEYYLSGQKADYALLAADGRPTALLEAKRLGESLTSTSHQIQMINYANLSGVSYVGLTNGNAWDMYDVFQRRPLEDKRVFQVHIADDPAYQCAVALRLLRRSNLELGQRVVANDPVLEEMPNGMSPEVSREPIDPELIISTVADHYDLRKDDLIARTRKSSVSKPRQVAMFLLTNELKLTPTYVGRLLGGRNHATVIHGANQVDSKIKTDDDLFGEVLSILEKATAGHSNPNSP